MPATLLSATWGLSQGRAHRQTRAVLLGTCALPPYTWSGHAHAAESWRVHTQLASGPGEGVGEGQLAFAQILARRVSWDCETSNGRKNLPKHPKVRVIVRRSLGAFSAQKRNSADEEGSRPEDHGPEGRLRQLPARGPPARLWTGSSCLGPPGRAQMIPAWGNSRSCPVA